MSRFVPHTVRHGSVVHSGDGSQWLQEFMQEQDMPQYDHRAYARRQSLPRSPRNNDHTKFERRPSPALFFAKAVVVALSLFAIGALVAAAV